MSHPPVIVIGSGGHAKVLIDTLLIRLVRVIGIVDRDLNRVGEEMLGVPIVGDDSAVLKHDSKTVQLVNGIGSIGVASARKQVFERFKSLGYTFASVIHPSAIIASSVILSEGVQVMAGAVIQAGSSFGLNTIVNTRVSVDHDCCIGAHVHLAPGVTLSGGVHVGDESHIGTGASIIQGIHVGPHCFIRAGRLVAKDFKGETPAILLK